MRKLLLVPVFVLVYLLAGGPTASAHDGEQMYVYLSLYDNEIDGRAEILAVDLAELVGFEFGGSADDLADAVAENEAGIHAYLADHFAIGESLDAPWSLEFGTISVLDLGARSYLLIPFDVTEEFESTPRTFEVRYDAIFDEHPTDIARLQIENDVRSGTMKNESDSIVEFSADQTVQVVSVDTVSTPEQIGAVRGTGTDAVRTGAVHLVFVLVLVAPIAFLVRGRGFADPAPSIAMIASRLGLVLLAFAGGHVVTLWLTGLGVLGTSDRVGVAAGALSLLALSAWAIASWRRPALAERELPLVAALGLLQGLALGARFVDDGLDRSRTLVSLVGYTLGVEVGLVIAAVIMIVPMVIIRRTPLALAVLVAVAAIGATYSAVWIVDGLFDTGWSLERIENPWRVWPRNLAVAVVIALAALGVRAVFASRGRLRPDVSAPTSEVETAAVAEPVPGR